MLVVIVVVLLVQNVVSTLTFALLKPDGYDHRFEIWKMMEDNGFKVVRKKEVTLKLEDVNIFYEEHKERSFFPELSKLMLSGKVYVCVVFREGGDVVKNFRNLVGTTDSRKARELNPNSIRARFGTDATANAIHASDSDEAAESEIEYFFPGEYNELVKNAGVIAGHVDEEEMMEDEL